jgi:Dolichyl-phosphate-mannose-protein mannosyltransferase
MQSLDSAESGVSSGHRKSTRRSESFFLSRLSDHWISLAVLAGLLVIVGLATSWNLEGWPGRVDDDEGTYVAQAWAILYEHTLTHYPYWYDHPPLGWAQIALFAWVTDGFNHAVDAVFVGRHFMWLVTMISCVLVYALCRRLSMRRVTSAATVLLFGLSPLAQFFHRLVSLDNVETMWVLAALVAAASPRRSWRQAFLTGLCAAIAVLSKETALILLPVIVWVLLRGTGRVGETDATVAVGADATPAPEAAPWPTAPGPSATGPAAVDPSYGGSAGNYDQGYYGPGRHNADYSDPGRHNADYSDPGRHNADYYDPGRYNTGYYDMDRGYDVDHGYEADRSAAAPSRPAAQEPPVWMPDWSAFASRHTGAFESMREGLHSPRALPGGVASGLRILPAWGQNLLVFGVTWFVIILIYPIYALQRGQLTLLWSTLRWQFFDRPGSGSLLTSGSVTNTTFHSWLTTDPWLLSAGLVAAVLMLGSARLRPFAAVLLLQVLVLCKDSYLPFFYVTAMIPFAAVVLGGAADELWTRADAGWFKALTGKLGAQGARYAPYAGRVVVAALALGYLIGVLPGWVSGLKTDSTANGATPYLAAITWAEHNVPKNSTVVVDDYLWVDLKQEGLNPLWLWKVNAVSLPDGWKSIGYIILQPQSAGTLAGIPALAGAYAHSVQVKDFGNGLTVRRVVGAVP